MIKSLSKLRIEAHFSVKSIYIKKKKKPVLTYLMVEEGSFSPRLGVRQRCPQSPWLLNIELEVLASTIRKEKEIKDIHIANAGKKKTVSICR